MAVAVIVATMTTATQVDAAWLEKRANTRLCPRKQRQQISKSISRQLGTRDHTAGLFKIALLETSGQPGDAEIRSVKVDKGRVYIPPENPGAAKIDTLVMTIKVVSKPGTRPVRQKVTISATGAYLRLNPKAKRDPRLSSKSEQTLLDLISAKVLNKDN